jgi:hypothetical protein
VIFGPIIKDILRPKQYKILHKNERIFLEEQVGNNLSEGLALLLNSFGVKSDTAGGLTPCFDVEELRRRNQNVGKKGK